MQSHVICYIFRICLSKILYIVNKNVQLNNANVNLLQIQMFMNSQIHKILNKKYFQAVQTLAKGPGKLPKGPGGTGVLAQGSGTCQANQELPGNTKNTKNFQQHPGTPITSRRHQEHQ